MTSIEAKRRYEAKRRNDPERRQKKKDYRRARVAVDPEYARRQAEYMANYRVQNRDKLKAAAKARYEQEKRYWTLRRYGLTIEEYERMLSDQGGLCATCLKPPNGRWKRLHIDHDHATGVVRGLLCESCNHALGKVGDNIETLERMVAYLRKHYPHEYRREDWE